MFAARLGPYVAAIVAVLLAGLAAGVAGLSICSPPPLPGDGPWTWGFRARQAIDMLLLGPGPACFFDAPAGQALLAAAALATPAVAAIALLALAWETLGRRARLALLRRRGGHAILAGNARELAGLSAREAAQGPVVYIAVDRANALRIARRNRLAEVAVIEERDDVPALLERLGAARARLVAATTRDDLANLAMADRVLGIKGSGALLLRIEQPSVRALRSHALRRQAETDRRRLAIVSLSQLQIRRGMALAMAGRYEPAGGSPVHVAICGAGPGFQEAAMFIARQAYGLERATPKLSAVTTTRSGSATAVVERLRATPDVIDLAVAETDAADALGLDRAIAGAALADTPLSAVHCVSAVPGEAEALALRWEQVFMELGRPVPPIVAYAGADARRGVSGMIRIAETVDLAEAGELARLMDLRARAVHASYLTVAASGKAGDAPKLPAETVWAALTETSQDDNRNVADHLDYKLALRGLAAGPLHASGATLAPDDIETLAAVEHARWMAAKRLAGFTYAPERDDRLRLHPDLLAYAELTEFAKEKDRANARLTPHLLALAELTLRREWPLAAPVAADCAADFAAGVAAIRRRGAERPALLPIVHLPLDGPGPVRLAESLLAAGIAVAVVQGVAVHAALADDASASLRERAAAILRAAFRIRNFGDADSRAAVAAAGPLAFDSGGGFDARALD